MTDPLTRADFESRTWDRLRALLEQRLAAQREQNDQRLDEVKTAHIRGRIAELKELLALGQQAQAPATRASASASFDAFPEA